MLVRVGVIFSRLFLAGALFLLIWAIVAFMRSGSWHPVNLAEALSYYKLRVPDFGLPGLSAVYGIVGSSWLFASLLVLGLMIALASAKAAPGSTTNYFRSILLLPVTIVLVTIGSFFHVVKSVAKYTFVAITSLVILICIWWGANYLLFAHKFSDSASCALRQTAFGDVNFDFIYDCVDASGVAPTEDHRYYVIFMARENHPDFARTGHAWLATMGLKRAASGDFLLTDYDVTGYGPVTGGGVPAECHPLLTRFYLTIRPIVPFLSLMEQYWCLKGSVHAEGPVIHDPAGRPLPKGAAPSAVDAMLGVHPAVVFAVSINHDQYNKVRQIIVDQMKAPPSYQLGLHDCTTFVRDIAEAIQLYVPPRVFAPYPSDSVYVIMQSNEKQISETQSTTRGL
jgi:hypothetical protein